MTKVNKITKTDSKSRKDNDSVSKKKSSGITKKSKSKSKSDSVTKKKSPKVVKKVKSGSKTTKPIKEFDVRSVRSGGRPSKALKIMSTRKPATTHPDHPLCGKIEIVKDEDTGEDLLFQFCNFHLDFHFIDEFPFSNKKKTMRLKRCRLAISEVARSKKYVYRKRLTCVTCKVTRKTEIFFEFRDSTSGRRNTKCKICIARYRKNNIKRIRKTQRHWRNSERGKAWIKIYREHYKNIRNEDLRQRKIDDPGYKLMCNYRNRIYECLLKHDVRQMKKIKMLGTTKYMFEKWMKYQFDDNMTFDNYGTYWQIDHVKPIASFNISNEDEAYECFSWKNCRPMEASANGSKGCKINKKLIESHKTIVHEFVSWMMLNDPGNFDDNYRYSYYTTELYGPTKN